QQDKDSRDRIVLIGGQGKWRVKMEVLSSLTTEAQLAHIQHRKPFPFSPSSTILKLRFDFPYSASLENDPGREEKEMAVDFLFEIPSEDNERKEKPKEIPMVPRFKFETTNNEAEYEALLAGLRIAQEMEIAKVAIFLDSQLLEPEQESRCAKQVGINDLRTSHKGSTSRIFDQKVNRGKRSFGGRDAGEEKLDGPYPLIPAKWIVARRHKKSHEDQNPSATIQANPRKLIQMILFHVMAPLRGPTTY
nr:putative ribonuclease H-like domain-containing protein [Tanacetum cinerariifolium]